VSGQRVVRRAVEGAAVGAGYANGAWVWSKDSFAGARTRLVSNSLREVAAGIPPLHLSRFMGHAKVTTTLAV
jgi:hypothetical protein